MFVPVVLPPLLAALEAEVKFNMEAADPDDEGEVRPMGSTTLHMELDLKCSDSLAQGCTQVIRAS